MSFGQDEHSQAFMSQWRKAKTLRDPASVEALAKSKGLNLVTALGSLQTTYRLYSGSTVLVSGDLESIASVVDAYTIVSKVS